MSSQRAEANQQEDLPGGVMATYMPHLLVQIIALLTASGGFILMAFSQWSGLIFALLFLLFQVCLHFFIKSTNSYVRAVPVKPLQIMTKVVQSAFIVLGMTAFCLLFWWLFQWCFFKVYNQGNGGGFYFDWNSAVLSLVPAMVWLGLTGEALRQFFPFLKQWKKQLRTYFTTWG